MRWCARLQGDLAADRATITLTIATGSLVLAATSLGLGGENLRATVDHLTRDPTDTALPDLLIEELDAAGNVAASEIFRNVPAKIGHPRYVDTVINQGSALVDATTSIPGGESPTDGAVDAAGTPDDGDTIGDTIVLGERDTRTGMFALEAATWAAAAAYAQERRAMVIINSPAAWAGNPASAISDAETGVNTLRGTIGNDGAVNALVTFPRLRMPDPLAEGRPDRLRPCGAVARIIAAPTPSAGSGRRRRGCRRRSRRQEFSYTMTDAQNGVLNQVGLNCLRTFPVAGHLLWGARTLADLLASEWKYVPVRRRALFLEESLYRGTQWVLFEPNDEPLWARIQLNIGAFMQNLFRQGGLQGTTPREAYFVKCDRETTTQNDIDRASPTSSSASRRLSPRSSSY